MAGAWSKEHGNFIFALQAQSVDRHVGFTGFDIGSVAHTQSYIRAGIFRSVGRGRDQFADIEVCIGRQMHNFLAFSFFFADNDGSDSIFDSVAHHKAQFFGFGI